MPRFTGMRLAIKFGPPPDTSPPSFFNSTSGSVDEETTLAFAISVSESCTFAITGGADAAEFELSGAGPGTSTTLRWASNGTQDYETPADADMDNNYVVQITATDTNSNATNQTITISVTNVTTDTDDTLLMI